MTDYQSFDLRLDDHMTRVLHRPGSAPLPVVLCHSLALDHRAWIPVLGCLPSDLDVIAYDIRAHGDTGDRPLFTLEACVGDLATLLDTLGLDRVHLAGLSMGGVIAQEFAIAHADRLAALTLLGTMGRGSEEIALRGRAGIDEGLPAQVEPTLTRWFSADYRLGDGPWVQYARDRILTWHVTAWDQAWSALARTNTLARLGAVPTPTLCLAGDADISTPPERLREIASCLPHARTQVLRGPHLFPIEHPEATARGLASHHRAHREV